MSYTDIKNRIFHIIFFGGVMLFLTGIFIEDHNLRMAGKPLPVIALLFMLKPDTPFRKNIFIAFVFSLIGDVLLEMSAGFFVFGLLSFLAAHLFFIMAFFRRKIEKAFFPAIMLSAFSAIYYLFLYPYLGDMAVPVFIYISVITFMVWCAAAQRKFNSLAKYATLGALFFMLSDSLLAFTKFYHPISYSGYFTILTYWTAQYLIFYSTQDIKQAS